MKGLERWEYWWEYNKDRFLARAVVDAVTPVPGAGARQDPLADQRVRTILPALRRAAGDRRDLVRAAAMLSLGKAGDLHSFPELYRGVADADPEVRKAALLGLAYLDAAEVAPILLSRLTDDVEDPGVRAFAAAGIGLLAAPGTASFLAGTLRDHSASPDLRGAVALALGEMTDEEARVALLAVSTDEREDERVRALAAASLGRQGRLGNVGALVRLLSDKSVEVRRSAALGLGAIPYRGEAQALLSRALAAREEWSGRVDLPPPALRELAALIDELRGAAAREEPRVAGARLAATRALADAADRDADLQAAAFALVGLGEVGGPDAVAAIADVLDRKSHRLKAWAGLAAGLAGAVDLAPFLRKAFDRQGEDPSVRAAMAIGLGLLRDGASADRLSAVALDAGEDPDLRGYCLTALALGRAPRAREAIETVLATKGNPSLHRAAALALGLVGRSGAAGSLVRRMSESNDPFVRAAATIGLGYLRDAPAVETLAALADDAGDPQGARLFAILALGYLGDRDGAPPTLSRLAWHLNYRVRLAGVDVLTSLL